MRIHVGDLFSCKDRGGVFICTNVQYGVADTPEGIEMKVFMGWDFGKQKLESFFDFDSVTKLNYKLIVKNDDEDLVENFNEYEPFYIEDVGRLDCIKEYNREGNSYRTMEGDYLRDGTYVSNIHIFGDLEIDNIMGGI